MAVSITYEVTSTAPGPGTYCVEFRVQAAVDIDPAIFVFDTEYGAFTGVATPYDLQTWPVGQAAAQVAQVAYFRSTGVLRNLPTVDKAQYFESYTQSRILRLQTNWQGVVDGFVGTETVTVPE